MSAKFRLSLAVAGLGLLMALSPAEARTYKWVDENGVTHYTQTPPPKGDYEKVRKPDKAPTGSGKVADDLEIRLDQFQKRRDEAAKAKAERDKERQETAKRRADCEKSKQNLEYFQTHPRIRYTNKDGSVSFLPDEERQKKMQAMRDTIKKLCQ